MSSNAIPVFDAAQLNRATNRDTSLQVEILALFVAEVERLMRQVEDATEPELRGDRLRALIAVARLARSCAAQAGSRRNARLRAAGGDLTAGAARVAVSGGLPAP
jgi:hypothetical protein